jgi:hypothetical protein
MDVRKRAARLRLQIDRERRAANGPVRFSAQLRAEVVNFMKASGMSGPELSRSLSLAKSILHRWAAAGDGSGKATPSKLRRVEIVNTSRTVDTGAVIVFPTGARIEGLTLAQIRALLGGGS